MVMLVFSLGLFNIVVLTVISLLHFYWAIGGKAWLEKSLPTTLDGKTVLQPGRIACMVVGLVLTAFAVVFLEKLAFLQLSLAHMANHYTVFVISIIFLARAVGDFRYVGFTKRIRTTTFGTLDTQYYSPLCLLLGVNGIVIEFLIKTFPEI